MSLEVLPVPGLPEIGPGDDLPAIVSNAVAPLVRAGDVVVVTQKVVSKAEGRLVPAGERDAWLGRETRRVIARRGELVIAETKHGFVCANAGIDASNVPHGLLTLLPEDPDASAAGIAAAIEGRSGIRPAVLVTDTFGRPWRRGLVEVAIGCAGLAPLLDLRGTPDAGGRELEATIVAVADEIASAAGLVMGKAERVPVAIVRGAPVVAASAGARDLVRPPEEDLFRWSPLETISTRRTVRAFAGGAVDREPLVEAATAALTAPVPHGSRRRTRPWTWIVLRSPRARRAYLDAIAAAWVRDMRADGADDSTVARRLARSDAVLGTAPVLAVPFLSLANADEYADDRRREAERDMFVLATGAAVQNFMLALHAQGLASAWLSSSLFCRPEAAEALGMAPEWLAMGTIAVGHPTGEEAPPRPPLDPSRHVRFDDL